jgi:transketolase
VIGIDRFGASGKAPDLYRYFGITIDHIKETVEAEG